MKPTLTFRGKNMNDKNMKTRSSFFCPQFSCQLLTALLLAPLTALHAAYDLKGKGVKQP